MATERAPRIGWVWSITYDHGTARVVLADQDALGGICETIGGALLNARWPSWVRLDVVTYRLAGALLAVSERHMRTLAKIPLTDDVRTALERHGVVDGDDETEEVTSR